jgi:hypothetical protein
MGALNVALMSPFFTVPDQAFKQNCQVLIYP